MTSLTRAARWSRTAGSSALVCSTTPRNGVRASSRRSSSCRSAGSPLARHANAASLGERHPDSIGVQVGDAAYWVVLLIALFLAAQPLGLTGATGPLGDMLRGFGQAVPHIIGASLIFFLGYVLAKVA